MHYWPRIESLSSAIAIVSKIFEIFINENIIVHLITEIKDVYCGLIAVTQTSWQPLADTGADKEIKETWNYH